MAVTVTISTGPTSVDNTQQKFIIEGTLVLTGSYGGASTHGDTMNLSGFDQIKSNQVPNWVDIVEAPPAGTAPTGYRFTYCPGTTQANGVLNISTNLTEYTQASAYSAGLLAAVLQFRAEFPSFL